MKIYRSLCLTLAIVCLFTVVGCQNTAGAYTFADMYALMTDENMVIQKYNILTGEKTPLCPDPVCPHTTEAACPFASASMLMTEDSTLYFVQDGEIYYDAQMGEHVLPQSIMRYDFAKGKLKVLCTITGTRYEGLQGRLIHADRYIYYSVRSADDTDESFELWRVKDSGGSPKKCGITTSWVSAGVHDGYAYYSDVTGVYRVDMKKKEMEYLLRAEEGNLLSIYFFDKEGGAYCVETSRNGSAVLYLQAGVEPVLLMEGMDISYMAVSVDTICYSEGNDLYTISRDTGEKTLLYTAALAETIIRIYSCGLGFVARYENAETMQSTFVPLRLVS